MSRTTAVRLGPDERARAGLEWSHSVLGRPVVMASLAGDASFRRYFRIRDGGASYVLMDAPPGKEDVAPFLQVRDWLESAGVRVPRLVAAAADRGFLLLEDFGDVTWAGYLRSGGSPDALVADALRQLHALQAHSPPCVLPDFNMARMCAECALYLDWYLPRVAGYTPSGTEREAFHDGLRPVLEALLKLPRAPVHLDYHSRNLMLPDGTLPLGVIDFQDAVTGPVTYDLASLLYDCYQDYPEEARRTWSRVFYSGLPGEVQRSFTGFRQWHRAVRLTALQRHIKAIGIFARLAHRDGKAQFLDEIPLTRSHLRGEMDLWPIRQGACTLLLMEPST